MPLVVASGSYRSLDKCVEIVALLKKCANQKDLHRGTKLHSEIQGTQLLEKNVYVATALINMYAKCGLVPQAGRVMDALPVHDVTCWNALVSGCVQCGQEEDALNCSKLMQHEGIYPNAVTFIGILKACGNIGAAVKGKKVHNEIIIGGLLAKDVTLGNALLDMYVKFGCLIKAAHVLDELLARDVVSWNTVMAGYADYGQDEDALNCFKVMQCDGVFPDKVTFLCTLKACGNIGILDKGEQIHDEIVKQKIFATDRVLGNALIDMYARCGALTKAAQVLGELPSRDVISWNSLIAGYTQHGRADEALECFHKLQNEDLSPNSVTFVSTLKACGTIAAAEEGEQIHGQILRLGWLKNDIVLGNALVDMYAKCGAMHKAVEVFFQLSICDIVSWNTLITGYAEQEEGEEALKCFEWMQQEGFYPNRVTYISILKACGSIRIAEKGKQIHDEIERQELLRKDLVLGNALVDMYAKYGALAKAGQVLNKLPKRDVVTWNSLIGGYVLQGEGKEALKSFRWMQWEGVYPNASTFIHILKACGDIGVLNKGKQIHHEIAMHGLLVNAAVGNNLVCMYAKCGALLRAVCVLEELPVRNMVSWSALIGSYAHHGQGEEALMCFERMLCEGLSPNVAVFACILSACSRSGLAGKGQSYFQNMSLRYGITPEAEHHTCMVDLFCRAGDFDNALVLINKMASINYLPVWHVLLGACQGYGNLNFGRLAFNKSVQIDKSDAVAYTLASNIYSATLCGQT